MPRRQQLEHVLRRIGRAAPRGVRGPLGRASRRFRWRGPVVTVVVVASDEETIRIGPALDSVRAQSYHKLDILVVPYGRCDGVRAAAAEHADQDWRVRVLGRAAADLAEARNAGAAAATGTYLVFASGGDDLPPRGIQRLVAALERSGSSLAVGRIQPPRSVMPSTEPPYLAAHGSDVSATTVARSPWAVTDLAVGNRMFRRTFWQEAGLRFTAERPSGSDVALDSLARAASFDLLRSPTYIPTNRLDGVSVGAVRDVLAQLEDWLEEQQRIWRAVEALGVPDVMSWLLWGVLDAAIHPFLDDVERASDHQWKTLRSHVELVLQSADEQVWNTLRAESRVKLWLLLNDRREQLEEYVAARLFDGANRPTHVLDGKVVAHLPFFGDPEVGVPAECYEMHASETPLKVVLHGVRWPDPETLELDLHARIDHVGFNEQPLVEAALVRAGSDERIAVPLRQSIDPRANQTEGRRYQDYSRGAVTLTIDARDLARRAATDHGDHGDPGDHDEPLQWQVELTVTTSGLTRTAPVSSIDDRGSAGMIDTGHLAPRLVDGARVGVTGREGPVFRLVARPHHGPRLEDVEVSGRRVTGTLRPGAAPLASVRVSMAGGQVTNAPLTEAGELLRFSLELPRPWAGSGTLTWRLSAVAKDGAQVPIAWPDQPEQWLGVGTGELVASRSASGGTELVEAKDALVLEDVELHEGRIEATARWLGAPPQRYALRLTGRRASLVGAVEPAADGAGVRATFATTWDEWGLGETAVPTGRYWFGLECGPAAKSRTGRVLVGADLLDRLLDFTVTDTYRFRPIRSGREAGVFLMPPLTDEEKGPFAQRRLQDWYASGELPIDPDAVYLQSYAGATATDSQLAIHHELRRRRPDLTLYWGIADRSSTVPEGGVPVVMYSREWYRVMASAQYLCLNIDFDRWFAARPEQRVLQTFHGYPAKSMGIRMWEAKLYTPRRIALELARTSGDWDLILTPAPEMDVYYRTEYRYDGPIHSAGYPRDDVLVSPDAERIRTEVRARLGIAPEQKVVLYAPTWRDDLATDWRSAELVRHLDLESASRALGPDYVFLMRGHRFHARGANRSERTARLLDVTDYPEINDLILASDAAVLDYSSLRFDFALTGRPMIFLVPDLATYTGGVRGFLYDFRDTAPGPLVDTADEVVARLRDLPGLAREYAEEQARFHAKYNYLQDGHAAERVVAAFFGARDS